MPKEKDTEGVPTVPPPVPLYPKRLRAGYRQAMNNLISKADEILSKETQTEQTLDNLSATIALIEYKIQRLTVLDDGSR